jgi:hypothetical protein
MRNVPIAAAALASRAALTGRIPTGPPPEAIAASKPEIACVTRGHHAEREDGEAK